LYREAIDVIDVPGVDGTYQLAPVPAKMWLEMKAAAAADGVSLFIVSAFRSYDYQAGLLHNKLADGIAIDDALSVVAPPGCSQHHTGCAVDVGTPGSEYLEEDFETTEGFDWLQTHAGRYGFTMPYARENRSGFIYEPWHWSHEGIEGFLITR
jgi:D-alanyl-D-alanine carboxypeptidase